MAARLPQCESHAFTRLEVWTLCRFMSPAVWRHTGCVPLPSIISWTLEMKAASSPQNESKYIYIYIYIYNTLNVGIPKNSLTFNIKFISECNFNFCSNSEIFCAKSGIGSIEWIYLARDRNCWWALLNEGMNTPPPGSTNAGNFVGNRGIICFLRRILLPGFSYFSGTYVN